MNNPLCKKVSSMLFLYIENKVSDEDRVFIENHFQTCTNCYNKYVEMKAIINNLHFEYEKLLNDFERIEQNQIFNIREYESFYQNISPYIDDELCYDESIKFRKYLLKSKPARAELANAYNLKNNIKHSVAMFKDDLHLNYSGKIVKLLKEENKYSFDSVYKRAAIIIGFMVTTLIVFSLYMGFNYMNESFAKSSEDYVQANNIDFDNNSDFVEFTFDGNNGALLTAK